MAAHGGTEVPPYVRWRDLKSRLYGRWRDFPPLRPGREAGLTTRLYVLAWLYNRRMQLSGRTVLVTGGASGLGGATVDMVVAAGGRAVIVDVNEDAGRAKAAAHGAGARFVSADGAGESVQRAVHVAVTELGGLDGVVNAAGVAVAARV